jgi:hypothetical protein
MADIPLRRFFSEPACPAQRQYEALRAVFLDGQPQVAVAERFGYSYDAFRQLVRQFRAACESGNPPPFSTAALDSQPPRPGRRRRPGRTSRQSPTPAP